MAKIYRKRGNKLNEVVTFDSACTRQENQPLVYDATDGSVHTTTHIGCLDADDVSVNNLTVTGQAIIQEQVTDTIDSNTLVLRSNADAGLTGTENSGVIIHNYNGSEDLYAVTDNTGTFRVGTAVSTTTTYPYLRYNETDNKWYSTAPGVTPAVEVTPVGSPTSWDSVVTSGDDVEYTNIIFSVIDRTSLQPLTTRDESTDMEADYLTKWNATDEKVVTTGTSCTHDLCANGNITSTGNITADGNVCVKTDITVDGNSCVSGDSTVSGEIHSCECITAPTACVSDDLYVAGDINNCNTNSIMHGYYGCFENNVCIKGDLSIDGVATLPGLVSDCVASVENTTNSSFYLPFVEDNHLVKGANDLYTNGDLQYNPSTDVLCTKTFCSDRGIVQSAISGVTAADLGLIAGTRYSLSTIVGCLQACCGNKAVSYSFAYADATNPRVTEYGNSYAYLLTFEKLDNNDFSGAWSKSRWLVTGENGVSWTVTGATTGTAGSITWTVCEHVVKQVCVSTAGVNLDYSLIFSACQPAPSCSKKTLFTDTANNLMYNPSTNTLKTCCINASASLSQGNLSYKYCFKKSDNSGRTTLLVLKDISCAVCCSDCAIGIIGKVCDSRSYTESSCTSIVEDVNFYIKANYGGTGSTAMDIKYYGYGEDQLRPVIITRNDNKVYAAMCISGSQRFLSFDTIGACSVIDEVCVDANGVYKDFRECTYAITKAGDLATLCVNASSSNVWTADQNTNYPIVFSTYQTTPTISCKTLYNDSANNLMYNPSTNTLTTCCICGSTKLTINNPIGCTSSVTGQSGSTLQNGVLELYSTLPVVDFHVNNASADFSHRIIAYNNCLRVLATNATGSTAATSNASYDFYAGGALHITASTGTAGLFARSPTSETPLTGQGPRVVFQDSTANQNGCLVFTDYDTYLSGASLTFATDQPASWFCSQYVKSNTDVTCSLRLYHSATATSWQSLACISFGADSSGGTTHCAFLYAACPDAYGINIAFGQNDQTIIYAGENAQTNFANFITQNGAGEKVVLVSDYSATDIVLNVNGGIANAYKWCFQNAELGSYQWNTTSATYGRKAAFRPINPNALSIDQGTTNNSLTGTNMFVAGQTNTVRANNTVVIGQSNTNGNASASPSNVIMIGTSNNLSYNNVSRYNMVVIGFCNYDCQTSSGSTIAIGNCNINSGDGAISIGYGGRAARYAVTIGAFNSSSKYYTSADFAIRIGPSTSANAAGACSIGIGRDANASGNRSTAIGQDAKAYSSNSIAIGCGSMASGSSTIALGTNTHAKGDGAVSIGYNATACIGFLALGTCARSDVDIDTTIARNPKFPYSSIIEIDDIKYGRHGRIKFVIPSCSRNIDITSFFNKLFINEINNGRCENTWSTSSWENIPTLVAHLSGFYWDDGGSSDGYQRWAPGINGRGNINELILLNTSAGASSNLSVYDLIVTCGKNICTTSWNWGTGTNVWTCGMVGTIEF